MQHSIKQSLVVSQFRWSQNWIYIFWTTHFPIRFWVPGSYQEGCTQDWCSRSMVSL